MSSENKKEFKKKKKLLNSISKKTGIVKVNWRKRRGEIAAEQEEKLIKEHEELKEQKAAKIKKKQIEDEGKPYSISIAIPGSFLNNAQSAELRTYMAGQIARAATLFCVDELIVYDETSRMTKDSIDSYWNGQWQGNLLPDESNYESCFYLARILEYLECPQYLRKRLFAVQRPLKYAGLLNPLDAHHHLKGDDISIPYREGIVVDKPIKQGRGPLCDIGLEKELQLDDPLPLPPGTRVTVEITNLHENANRYRGKVVSAKKVREKTGLYWGYSVKLAASLKDVLDRSKFDIIIGTSNKGGAVKDMHICTLTKVRLLIVFGGVSGVDAALEGEEALHYQSAEEAFDRIINSLPNKGSRTERVEENILVTLSEVSMRMDQLCA